MGFFDSPTREIALALYTGGFRPGLFANLISKLPGPLATMVEFNDVELTIKREQPRVEAAARWPATTHSLLSGVVINGKASAIASSRWGCRISAAVYI